ncbi:MAG: hypothetical protein QG670_1000 [Thermoproteota archaeon]|nr:hypothetical protein [Thermoproteota archaeon]
MPESQNKGISIVIGLVALVLLLGVSNAYFYTSMQSQIDRLNTDKTNLQSQITALQSIETILNTTYQNYVSTHIYSNTQYNNLNTSYNLLKAPKLSDLDLSFEDVRPILQTPYLHVTGKVWNVGNSSAYNSQIHITLYQGAVVAEETSIGLGDILGEYRVSIDQKIYYTGSNLTNWTHNLTWMNTL